MQLSGSDLLLMRGHLLRQVVRIRLIRKIHAVILHMHYYHCGSVRIFAAKLWNQYRLNLKLVLVFKMKSDRQLHNSLQQNYIDSKNEYLFMYLLH